MEEIHDEKTSVCLDVGHVNAYSKADVMEWMKILKKYKNICIYIITLGIETHI